MFPDQFLFGVEVLLNGLMAGVLYALVALVREVYLPRDCSNDPREIDCLSAPSLVGASHDFGELLAPSFQSGLERLLHKIACLRRVGVNAGVHRGLVPVFDATGGRIVFEFAERFNQI